MTPTTVIVIPCYNEAARLAPMAFLRFTEMRPDCRLLFVNDGSTDETMVHLHRLRDLGHGQIEILDLPQNSGKAEAVRRGMLHGFDSGARYVGFLDADLAAPLSVIPQFCDVLDRRPDCHLVVGCRLPLLGRVIARRYFRQVLGNLFCVAASGVLRLSIRDTQCGAKLFRVTPECRQVFSTPFVSRWIFDVEVMKRLLRLWRRSRNVDSRQAIFEYVLDEWHEIKGSKLRPTDFLRAFLELFRIAWQGGVCAPIAATVDASTESTAARAAA
jgi:dolichyl-phosphate beta-glucosyltransferase